MPLTIPAHQVAILPLLKVRRLPPLALIVGSCVPDLFYLAPPNEWAIWAHRPLGAVLSALSVGLVFYLWAQRLLLPTLTQTLPNQLASRLITRSPASWGWVLLSLSLGALTHVALDSLTHPTLWPGSVLPKIALGGVTIPLTKILQHGLSIVGSALVLLTFFRRAPAQSTQRSSTAQRLAIWLSAIIGAIAGVVFVLQTETPAYLFRLGWSAVCGAIIGVTLFCLSFLWASRGEQKSSEKS